MNKIEEIRTEIRKIAEHPTLTNEAVKQLNELYGAEQCLMSLEYKQPLSAASEETDGKVEIFTTLVQYQNEHSIVNLKKLCNEVAEFCLAIYASTQSDEERKAYKDMVDKVRK